MIKDFLRDLEEKINHKEEATKEELYKTIEDLTNIIVSIKENEALEEYRKMEYIRNSSKFNSLSEEHKKEIDKQYIELKDIKRDILIRREHASIAQQMENIISKINMSDGMKKDYDEVIKIKRLKIIDRANQIMELENNLQLNAEIKILDL